MGVEVALAEEGLGVQAVIDSRDNPRTNKNTFLDILKSIILLPWLKLLGAVSWVANTLSFVETCSSLEKGV